MPRAIALQFRSGMLAGPVRGVVKRQLSAPNPLNAFCDMLKPDAQLNAQLNLRKLLKLSS